MKQAITLITLILFFNLYAQTPFYHAKISLTNGETKEGYAELPQNTTFSKSVYYKESKDAKKTTIKDDAIATIIYYTDQGKEFVFERLPIRTVMKSFGKWREKKHPSKAWILMRFSNPFINLYFLGNTYAVDKTGNMISKANDYSGTWAEIPMLLKRPEETAPTHIASITSGATIIGKESLFRKTAAYYFENETEFVKRIDAEEFKSSDMIALVQAYIEYKTDITTQK
jgi:hypothetical protein